VQGFVALSLFHHHQHELQLHAQHEALARTAARARALTRAAARQSQALTEACEAIARATRAGQPPDTTADGITMNGEYTDMAEHYDSIMLSGYYDYPAIVDALVAADPGHTVLELGAGTGLILQRLAARRPDLELTGVDLTAAMLARAADRLRPYPRVRLELQNVVALDLDRHYDLAFSYGGPWYFTSAAAGSAAAMISHIRDPQENRQGLERLAAHLAPGATLLLGIQAPHHDYTRPVRDGLDYAQSITPIPDGFEKRYCLSRAGWPVMQQTIRYRTLSVDDAIELLDKCGLEPCAGVQSPLFKAFRTR